MLAGLDAQFNIWHVSLAAEKSEARTHCLNSEINLQGAIFWKIFASSLLNVGVILLSISKQQKLMVLQIVLPTLTGHVSVFCGPTLARHDDSLQTIEKW